MRIARALVFGLFLVSVPAMTHAQYDGPVRFEDFKIPVSTVGYDYRGTSFSDIALEGNTLVAALPTDSLYGTNSGAVFIFQYNMRSDEWDLLQTLTSDSPSPEQQFGTRVSLDRGVLAVSSLEDNGDSIGAIYIYTLNRRLNTWRQRAKILPPDDSMEMAFGEIVLVRNTLVAGYHPHESQLINGDYPEPSLCVYTTTGRRNSRWRLSQRIYADYPTYPDVPPEYPVNDVLPDFGSTFDFDGKTIAAVAKGTSFDDLAGGYWRAAAFVFEREGKDGWRQTAVLQPEREVVATNSHVVKYGHIFGSSIAVDGDRIAVGAGPSAYAYTSFDGSTFLFKRDHHLGRWEEYAEFISPTPMLGSGDAVLLRSQTVIATAPRSRYGICFYRCYVPANLLEDPFYYSSGTVFVYMDNDAADNTQPVYSFEDSDDEGLFGHQVAANRRWVAVLGSKGFGSNEEANAIYLYQMRPRGRR